MFGMNGWCKEPNNAGNGSDCPKNAQNSEDRTTGDLISRAAAIDALDEIESEVADGEGFQYEKWRSHIAELPSAQPEQECEKCIFKPFKQFQPERKKGKWIRRDRQDNKGKPLYGWYQCSECGAFIGSNEANFCSECGADMRRDPND